MTKKKQAIIDDITKYFGNTNYSECYVGIASDVNKRLFEDHNVSKEHGHWIYIPASSDEIAREIEQYFIDAGMDGGTGGGDSSTNIVYAYLKTSSTEP